MIRRVLLFTAFLGSILTLLWIGHTLLFTSFMLYDDEGYVLLTLRDFGTHGGLYERIFTQYGPAFYVAYDLLQRTLDFAWTSTTARWITLGNWMAAAAACCILARRARLAWPLVLFLLVNVFTFLWIMTREPMHPGGTITLLVAAAAWLGWEAIRAERPHLFAVVLGLIGATLALTKINVGAFLILSTVFWLALTHDGPGAGRVRLLLLGLAVLVPVALMRSLLGAAWIQTYVILSALATISVVLAVAPVARAHPAPAWTWLAFAGMGVAVAVAVAVVLLARDTSLAGLWQGVIVAPLQHPGVYSFPQRWRPGVLVVGLGALLLVWAAVRRPDDPRLQLTVAWVRIIVVALFQLTLLPSLAISQAALALSYGLPLAGLFALPLGPARGPGPAARAWLAVLLAFQSLHAYPVAGSQLNWGTFLWLPLMLLGLQEALERVLAGTATSRARIVHSAVAGVALVLAGGVMFLMGRVSLHNSRNGEELRVPGAEKIVLPAQIASALRVVTENAGAHAAVLLSLPGTFSLNQWSGAPTPTLANATHWFSLLRPAQHEAILARLEAEPRAVFVVQHNVLATLIETGFRPTSPVLDYLRANFTRAFAVEGYSFWIRSGRTIAPLSTGRVLPPSGADDAPLRLELTLAARPGQVAAIEIWNVTGAQWQALRLDAGNTRADVTPLDDAGQALAPRQAAAWPLALAQVTRLGLEFHPLQALPPAGHLEAVLLDAQGQRLGAARILPDSALTFTGALSAGAPPAGG